MKPGPHTRIAGRPSIMAPQPPRQRARLSLHPEASTTGGLDGAWWPRTLDLTVELPPLLTATATRLDQVIQVAYHPDAWNTTVSHLCAEGQVIRMAGLLAQPTDIITLTSADHEVLSLLVMPPDSTLESVHHAIVTAPDRDAP
jgi:hypothetical protein